MAEFEKSAPPWTDAQVASLTAFQASGHFHPFTCPGTPGTCKNYLSGDRTLLPTRDGWVCRCGRSAGVEVVPMRDYIAQSTVLEQWPWLTTKKLAEYRRKGRVRFLTGKGGEFVYPLSDIERALMMDLDGACPEITPPLNTEGNGSTGSEEALAGTGSGTTESDDERASRVLELRISTKPKTSSSPLPRSHRSAPDRQRMSRC